MNNKKFNLTSLTEGQKIKVYSKDKDIFSNEKTEIYCISREQGNLYLSYEKKNSFDDEDLLNISFKNKIDTIGSRFKRNIDPNLTEAEKKEMVGSEIINNTIIIGCDLMGEYDNEITFTFPNIILFENIKN